LTSRVNANVTSQLPTLCRTIVNTCTVRFNIITTHFAHVFSPYILILSRECSDYRWGLDW
jgi:hypothetical protein